MGNPSKPSSAYTVHSFQSLGNLFSVISKLWMLQILEYWAGRGMLQIL